MNANGTPDRRFPTHPDARQPTTDRDLSDLPALTRGLLEQVLEETETASQETATDEPAELPALLQVARKYRGASLLVDPVLTELVEVVLESQFGKVAQGDDWRAISRQVAETLHEDPESQRRLNDLWARLSQRGQ